MTIDAIQAFMQQHAGLFLALTVWTLIWKGLALWKASHKQSKAWFIILLVVNTFGILDVIYYYLINNGEQA